MIIYSVVTEKEQKCMNEINDKLKLMEKLIVTQKNEKNKNMNDKTIKQNKELINCTLDALIKMVNHKRKEILIDLDENYKNSKQENVELIECFNELKQIYNKCQLLLSPQSQSNYDQNKYTFSTNSRYEAMTILLNEWQNKYKNLSQINRININVRDMYQIKQQINNIISIESQKVNLMNQFNENQQEQSLAARFANFGVEQKQQEQVSQPPHNPPPPNINGLAYNEQEIDAIEISQESQDEKNENVVMNESDLVEIKSVNEEELIISDEIDVVYDDLIYEHRPARAFRWDKDQSKWRGRGKGKLSIYFNKKQNLARIIFLDEKHEKTRLLQWINGGEKAEFVTNERKKEDEQDEIEWNGNDYTMDLKDPMFGRWKLTFNDSPPAA